ncbi:MAG: hypothetical protein HDT24_02605, partial [Ruminococcus sp.]|nr:hypothetical protein [Ruminococcus sp.]
FEKLVEIKDSSVERLLKAFPQLRSVSYSEAMETLRKRLNNRISVSGVKQGTKSGGDKNDGG